MEKELIRVMKDISKELKGIHKELKIMNRSDSKGVTNISIDQPISDGGTVDVTEFINKLKDIQLRHADY